MQWLRAKVKLVIWFLVIAFIGTIFVAWGMQGISTRENAVRTNIAVVNDTPISANDFYQVWSQQISEYRKALGGSFSEDMAEAIKPRLFKNMVRQEVLLQEAQRQGLIVTAEELKRSFKSIFVREDGSFDEERYKSSLQDPALSWNSIEAEAKRSIMMQKLGNSLGQSLRVTDAELREAYKKIHRRVRLELAVFPADKFLSEVRVSDVEVARFYEKNKADYEKPETVTVSHILIRVKDNAGPDDDKKALTKIEDIARQLKAGKDFVELAKNVSEDPGSAPEGGRLGEIQRGMMVPEFEKAAFTLRKGGLSPVVRTQYGFHIIKCDGHKDKKVTSLSAVRDNIRKTFLAKKALALAGIKGQTFADLVKDAKTWDAGVKKYKVNVEKTLWWKKGEPLGSYGSLPAVENTVFISFKGEVSDALPGEKIYFVTRIIEEKYSGLDLNAFEKERDDLYNLIYQSKQQLAFNDWAEDAVKRAKVEDHYKEFETKEKQ